MTIEIFSATIGPGRYGDDEFTVYEATAAAAVQALADFYNTRLVPQGYAPIDDPDANWNTYRESPDATPMQNWLAYHGTRVCRITTGMAVDDGGTAWLRYDDNSPYVPNDDFSARDAEEATVEWR
jgi:hypothetical protein